ncbi:hypothetical protein HPP92_027639 [Vanilla planifolia]|nr:hypothetical protein HPP92_027639 [Vanilla planifolia]
MATIRLGGGRSFTMKLSSVFPGPSLPHGYSHLKPNRVSFPFGPKSSLVTYSNAANRDGEQPKERTNEFVKGVENAKETPEKVKEKAEEAKEIAKGMEKDAARRAEEAMVNAKEKAKGKAEEAKEKTGETAEEVKDRTKEAAGAVKEKTMEGAEWANETVQCVREKAKQTVEGVWEAAKETTQKIKETVVGKGEDEDGADDYARRYEEMKYKDTEEAKRLDEDIQRAAEKKKKEN